MMVRKKCLLCKSYYQTNDFRRKFCSSDCAVKYHCKHSALKLSIKRCQSKLSEYAQRLELKKAQLEKLQVSNK